jgi:DNA repair protein RAD16
MNVALHPHQLKGAAQMLHLCDSPFNGGILADAMGLGKTFTAAAVIHAKKEGPGFSLVVAPKSLCLQWVAELEGAWEEVSLLMSIKIDATDSNTSRTMD